MQTSLAQTFGVLLTQLRRSLWTALPGRVQSFDSTKQAADIEPLIHDTWEGEDGTNQTGPLPVIPSVPVCFPGSGAFRVTFPVAKGDTGLLVFCSRSIDRWLSEGGSVDPQDDRTHDLSDAVFVPGLNDLAHPIDPFKTDRLTIGKVGGQQIHIGETKTQVGTDDPSQLEPGMLGNTTSTFLSQFRSWAISHTHPIPSGGATSAPTSPSVPPMPALPTMTSQSVEIKK
jgi:hypothetical protein